MNEFVLSQERAEATKPDAIIIIGAGLRRMYGEIVCSVQSVYNVDKAIDLLEELRNKNIALVFSGGFSLDSETEAKTMEKYFKETYPEIYNYFFDKAFRISIGDFNSNCSIHLESKSRNSYDNIRYSLDLAEQNGWRNIIIIDQPMHLPQLKLLAHRELRKRHLRIHLDFVAAEMVWGCNVQKQWASPLKFLIYEILSTGYYMLKGKII